MDLDHLCAIGDYEIFVSLLTHDFVMNLNDFLNLDDPNNAMRKGIILLSLITILLLFSGMGSQAKIRYTFHTDFMNIGVGNLSDPQPVYEILTGFQLEIGTITQIIPEIVLDDEAVFSLDFDADNIGFPSALRLGDDEYLVFVNYDVPGTIYPELKGRLIHYKSAEILASIELGGSLNSSTSQLFFYQGDPMLAFQNGNTFSVMEYNVTTQTLNEVFNLKEFQDNSQYTYVRSFKIIDNMLYLLGGTYFYNTTLSYEDFSLITLDLADYNATEVFRTPVGESPSSFTVTSDGYLISSRTNNGTHLLYHLRNIAGDSFNRTYYPESNYIHLHTIAEDTYFGYSYSGDYSTLSLFNVETTEGPQEIWENYLSNGFLEWIQVISSTEVYLGIFRDENFYIEDIDMETGEFELQGTANTFSITDKTDFPDGDNTTYEPFGPFRGEIEIPFPFIFSVFGMGFVAVWSRRYRN